MKRVLTAALAVIVMISAVTGVTVLTGRLKNSVVPVAHAIPLNASVSLPSASSKLENAAGPAMTSGAALCAVVTPATPDAVETAAATIQRKAEEKAAAEAKAVAEAKAKAEAEAKAKAASQLMATMNSGKSLGSGVINGSDVRLRSDANTSSSILATLSRGTSVTVLAESGSWYAVSYNGTAGYVAKQYVTLGDSLPADTGSTDTSAGSSTDTGSSTVPSGSYGSSAVSIAYQYLGVPYVYGGASPSGFDCSGFTMYVYAQLGVSLPHGATPQLNYGTYVSRSDLQPGDLVFFSDGSYPASHVGIYVGDDQFIHASSSSSNGYCVCVSSLNSNYYSRNFVGGRRF
jgi:cell wall-associated NlpC family hydrolase